MVHERAKFRVSKIMKVWISKCLHMLQREYHINTWFINAVINLLFYLFTYHSFTSLWTLMSQGNGFWSPSYIHRAKDRSMAAR